MDRVKSMMLFPMVDGSITGVHRFKVRGKKFERCAKHVFHTTGDECLDALPEEVVEADTIAAFKKHLDKYMNKKGIEEYGSYDTKLGGNLCCEDDAKRLQGDLDYLVEWKADFYLNGGSFGKDEVQKNLGVMAEQSLIVGRQVQQAVRKANGMLGFV
eukprot:g21575.t1